MRGSAEIVIPALAAAIGAPEVLAGRLYQPWARERDRRVAEALEAAGRRLRLATSSVLREPARVMSGSGKPYAVYTPFAKAVAAMGEPDFPILAPTRLRPVATPPPGDTLDSLALYPVAGEPDWAAGFPALWTPGEAGAQARLARFVAGPVAGYAAQRNDPGTEGTSGLSPHLHWGEISPRQVWHAVRQAQPGELAQSWPFLSEVLWREFAYHLLWHRPELPERAAARPLRRLPLAAGCRAAARLAARPDRLPDRRCRHAPALAAWLDAQPGPHDHRHPCW